MRIRRNRHSRHPLFTLAVVLLLSSIAPQKSSSAPAGDPVRQVDHIVLWTKNAEEVFRLLSEKLALPIAWPYRSYGAFASGGVSLGNVNIEVLKMPAPDTHNSVRTRAQASTMGFVAFALDPSSVSGVVALLDAQGLKHDAPAPIYRKDPTGKEQLIWTTIQTSLPPAPRVFFCKYNFDEAARRTRLARKLADHGGGPLGIQSATELVLGVRHLAAARRDWQRVLGPSSSGGRWKLGSGPVIRLVASQENRLSFLRVKVKSLATARAFLRSQNLLGLDRPQEISLRRSEVGGADIRLVQ